MNTGYDEKRVLIKRLVAKGRRFYGELRFNEKRAAVACCIRERAYVDKTSLLTDADREGRLPDLVAEVIASNGTLSSAVALIEEVMDIFICRDAYFADEIDEALEEEMIRQPLDYADDMRAQDAAERARDMREAV